MLNSFETVLKLEKTRTVQENTRCAFSKIGNFKRLKGLETRICLVNTRIASRIDKIKKALDMVTTHR